jgi:hypothetical protein
VNQTIFFSSFRAGSDNVLVLIALTRISLPGWQGKIRPDNDLALVLGDFLTSLLRRSYDSQTTGRIDLEQREEAHCAE